MAEQDGQADEALALLQRARQWLVQHPAEAPLETALAWRDEAGLLLGRQRVADAQQALVQARGALAGQDGDAARRLAALLLTDQADLHMRLAHTGDALALYRQALAAQQALRTPQPLDQAEAWRGLAAAQRQRGQARAALASLHSALALAGPHLPAQHTLLASLHNGLSETYRGIGSFEQAQSWPSRPWPPARPCCRRSTPDLAVSLNNLA